MQEDISIALDEDVLDWRYKAFPPTQQPLTVGDLIEQNWNALSGDLLFPAMVLKQRALKHNISLMAQFCQDSGVDLAPHGKTTMSPEILLWQLEAGAWGITAATIGQVRTFRSFGANRILLANQLLEPTALRWISRVLAEDPNFSFLCLVDSVAGVNIMVEALADEVPKRPIRVAVEFGHANGRGGCRTAEDFRAVALAVDRSPHLELAGVEGYEGLIVSDSLEATESAVNDFLKNLRSATTDLAHSGFFDHLDEIIVTAGGSAFFDLVVRQLASGWNLSKDVRVILRSGCYVTHDSGTYDRLSPLAGRSKGGASLQPAIEVWGVVLSRPEPDLAIVGMGKRDLPYDLDMPVVQWIRRRNEQTVEPCEGVKVSRMNDQHVFVRPAGTELAVGDLLGFGISHPCTAFDKWRLIPLVDDSYRVLGCIHTFF